MNEVVGDAVLATLPHHDSRCRPVDFAGVVNPIVGDLVLPIHVFGAGPVTRQQHADATNVADLVVRDPILLAMQIQPYGGAAASGEAARLYRTGFGSSQTDSGGWTIEHFPMVLQAPAGETVPPETFRMTECQAAKDQPLDRLIFRSVVVGQLLYPHQFCQGGYTIESPGCRSCGQ